MKIKIKIKNKNKILIKGFNWKEKSIQQKKKINQMNEDQFENNNMSKIGIEG